MKDDEFQAWAAAGRARTLEMRERRLAALTDVQRAALTRHGYPAHLTPIGHAGDNPGATIKSFEVDGQPTYLRNRVCELDGIIIDGHDLSDLDSADPDGPCLSCGLMRDEWADPDGGF